MLNGIVIWFDSIDSFVIHRNSFSSTLDLLYNVSPKLFFKWSQWSARRDEMRWDKATRICRNRYQSNFSFIVLLIIFICNRMNFSFSSVIDKTFDEFIHGSFPCVSCKRSKSYPWIMDWVYWGYLKQNWTMAS